MTPELFFTRRQISGGYVAVVKIDGICERFSFTARTSREMVQELDDIMEDCCDLGIDKALENGILDLFDRKINEISQVEAGEYVFRCAADTETGVMHTIIGATGKRVVRFPQISR